MAYSKPTLSFAGLGAMGFGMASHLVRSGFQVTGFDLYEPLMSKFLTLGTGAKSAKTPREAVQGALFLICMVATSVQATPLLFDFETGAVQGLVQNATIIICSTVAPAYISEVRNRLDQLGRADVCLLDCPVSGGPVRAAEGKLSIFSSGETPHLSNANEILSCMSGHLYPIPGDLGGGSKAKLIHQIFAAINIAMASEAMGLAAVAGMNTRTAFEQLKVGAGWSWMLENRVSYMLEPGRGPYSSMTIITKDAVGLPHPLFYYKFPLPLTSIAEQLYLTAISAGWAKEDDCELVRLYLPGKGDLVVKQTDSSPNSKPSSITVDTIKDLLIGVHLVGMVEAMSFCDRLGIDASLMHGIVLNAAGASNTFREAYTPVKEGNWSLKQVPGAKEIRDKLAKAIDDVYALKYPLFLSCAALQELHRQLM
ncbi:MAG: hypothetical protein LQ342_003004 [Letrouitia transgressa]|nr:MAG: hypothetical protein LQ342_003004 [Letrouitia transgressa]